MKRTDADGATIDNKFSEGNPSTGVEATVVDETWLNTLQEELAYIVESAGITLDQTGTDTTQIAAALGIIGIAKLGPFTLANNVSGQDITGLLFDKSVVRAVEFDFYIERRTDTQNVVEKGHFVAFVDPEADAWLDPQIDTIYDDTLGESGVVLSMTATGQIQYTTSNLSGASYAGSIRVTNVKQTKI